MKSKLTRVVRYYGRTNLSIHNNNLNKWTHTHTPCFTFFFPFCFRLILHPYLKIEIYVKTIYQYLKITTSEENFAS